MLQDLDFLFPAFDKAPSLTPANLTGKRTGKVAWFAYDVMRHYLLSPQKIGL
jgi:hypothetical protein